ncbi:hypothetical protein [Brachybacterium hainanense]|uniref:Uncharacterized protein n=1 Tax=Brachybacterium hainanense TaxID=1541174 RepID=A0ABV6RBU7_9MICO
MRAVRVDVAVIVLVSICSGAREAAGLLIESVLFPAWGITRPSLLFVLAWFLEAGAAVLVTIGAGFVLVPRLLPDRRLGDIRPGR